MNTAKMTKHVKRLILKASSTGDPDRSVKYSQAALNVANALEIVQLKLPKPTK